MGNDSGNDQVNQLLADMADLLPPDIAAKSEHYRVAFIEAILAMPESERQKYLDDYRRKHESVIQGPTATRCDGLTVAPEPHEFIVDQIVPVANGELAAPGGTGKTTVEIWEAIHVITGRNVWGHEVLRPGGVLFVTAEDSRRDFEFRLWFVMANMVPSLTPEERQRVLDHCYIEDVTGKVARLAELDRSGNIVPTSLAEDICKKYRGEGLAIVHFDPLSHFSPGERFVNDSESILCQVSANASKELKAHVRLTHHVSKEVARSGITDQYVGRNGAALADNSRFVAQLAAGTSDKHHLPHAASPLANTGYLPLRMHFHKISYAAIPAHPYWLMRKGWEFREFYGGPVNEIAVQHEEMQKIQSYLRVKLHEGIKLTKTMLETNCTENLNIKRERLRQLVEEGLQRGELVEKELPETEKATRRTRYLAPGGE